MGDPPLAHMLHNLLWPLAQHSGWESYLLHAWCELCRHKGQRAPSRSHAHTDMLRRTYIHIHTLKIGEQLDMQQQQWQQHSKWST